MRSLNNEQCHQNPHRDHAVCYAKQQRLRLTVCVYIALAAHSKATNTAIPKLLTGRDGGTMKVREREERGWKGGEGGVGKGGSVTDVEIKHSFLVVEWEIDDEI